MATAVAARRLTETHRLAQARLAADTVRQLAVVWPLLDPANLDPTFDRWLRAVVPVVQRQRDVSARVAANYLAAFRAHSLGPTIQPAATILAAPAPVEALTTSMLVTGPVSIRSNLARGVPFARAVDQAAANTSRSAMRHTLNGGRDTILATTRADKRAAGWQRVTSGNTCAFCAMLASRGAVYSEDSADFESHDGCGCVAEPVYGSTELTGQAAEYRNLWNASTRDTAVDDDLNAFRQALNA